MIVRRSVISGVIAGLLLCLVALYPMISIYLFPQVLEMQFPWPAATWLRAVVMLSNGFVGFVAFLTIGGLAALRVGVTDALSGFKAGGISGLVVGVVFYIIILSPTTSFTATMDTWKQMPAIEAEIPQDILTEYLDELTWGMLNELTICLILSGLIGGVEGALVGWARRHKAVPEPTLLGVLDLPKPRRHWFERCDSEWRAGVLAGIISGVVLGLGLTIGFFADLESTWPRLKDLVAQSGKLSRLVFSKPMVGLLSPFVLLMLIGTGAIAVLLLKDPPQRYWSRFKAVLISGGIAAVPIYLSFTRFIYFNIGVARHFMFDVMHEVPELDPAMIAEIKIAIHEPGVLLPTFFLLPLVIFFLVAFVSFMWMIPQALFYGLLIPVFVRRPADRAASIVRTMREEPNTLLPQLYALFKSDVLAVEVLPHLAFGLADASASRLVAAYHALRKPDLARQAVPVIRQTVHAQTEWRWRAEVEALYRILEQGLEAQTLAQISAIRPPPEDVTSSLPPLLAKSCDGVGHILGELKKIERVDDLNTKIIFLNSAQAALLELRRYLTDRQDDTPQVEYPETGVLHVMLDGWQALILGATHDLQGRADLQSTRQIGQIDWAERVRQEISVTNRGLNVAQHVRLRVDDGEGYTVVEGAEQEIDILSPQETRTFEVWLSSDSAQRVRLVWHLTFDDAIDDNRHVEFADVIEFTDVAEAAANARPFQRIFPIPYVTGTPLRSGEMFVGREDVFDFVRENLLGTYQNNVIVLHGQRRTGKTSILYRLQEVMAETHIAVLVDMQGKAARGTADFLYALSDDIAYELENHGIAVELPGREEYEQAPEFAFRSRFLRAVIEKMDATKNPVEVSDSTAPGSLTGLERPRNLLLMFDEFEELQKRVEDGKLEPEIFTFLRNLMQHEPRVDFVFSGTHKLEELGAEYWSILFNIAAYKRITFLAPEHVQRLIVEPVAPYGLEYDPLALQRIVQVTAGHPYFTQVVCHELVAYHNETQRNYLTTACVDKALEQILERGEAHFKYIWTGATPDEQRVLLALTDLLPDTESTVTPTQVAAELERKGQALAQDALLDALTHLCARDILTRAGPQSTLYRFKIDLIRRWIAATRPTIAQLSEASAG